MGVNDDYDKYTLNVTSQTVGVLTRKRVRNLLLRKRGGFSLSQQDALLAKALSDIIDEQIAGYFSLNDFTFQWDIHPVNPLKVITPFQWESEGGQFDSVTGLRTPPAFTRQAI